MLTKKEFSELKESWAPGYKKKSVITRLREALLARWMAK
jgi:hypothetical protein